MAITVQSIYNDATKVYPDFTQANFLLQFNTIDTEILMDTKFRPEVLDTVSLTSGQRLYTLDDNVLKIVRCEYQTGASTFVPMTEASLSELDQISATWRTDPVGVPQYWYEDSGSVGFYPIPATTTSAGYPVVRQYSINSVSTAILIGDSLPQPVPTGAAWLYGCLFRFAMQYHKGDIALWSQQYALAKIQLYAFMGEKLPGLTSADRLSFMSGMGEK